MNRNKSIKTVRPTRARKATSSNSPPPKPRARVPRPVRELAAASQYETALINPFSPKAEGAAVPDQYSVPTSTLCWRTDLTITANSGGLADLIILPSLLVPAVSTRGITAGAAGPWLTASASVANGLVYNTPANLSSKLSAYRIVSYGARVKAISAMTALQGNLTAALVPIESHVYSSNLYTVGGQTVDLSNVGIPACLNAWNMPEASNALDVSRLVQYPQHKEYSMQQLSAGPIQIVPKHSSPNAFVFRDSQDSYLGFDMTSQSSIATVGSGNASFTRADGWQAIVLGITGGTPAGSSVQVELVYHLEGPPQLTASAGFVSETAKVSSDPLGFLQALHRAAGAPSFMDMASTAMRVGGAIVKML